jgi:hypothetical protein
MTSPPLWPSTWPTNPLEIEPPPTVYPFALDQLTIPQLKNGVVAMTLLCGRAKTPLKTKHRAIVCVLSTILQAEIDRRSET